jgi:hypothetical protein
LIPKEFQLSAENPRLNRSIASIRAQRERDFFTRQLIGRLPVGYQVIAENNKKIAQPTTERNHHYCL